MDFDDYQKQATRTAVHTEGHDAVFALMYLSMGLAGESGEVIEKLKKAVRDEGGTLSDEKRDEVAKELGDVLWYLSQLAHTIGYSLNAVAELNLKKLADRAERGVLKGEGDNR